MVALLQLLQRIYEQRATAMYYTLVQDYLIQPLWFGGFGGRTDAKSDPQ